MNFGIFGLFDIIILSIGILVIIFGYKKGFMRKFMGVFGILIVIGLSILLASSVAKLMIDLKIFYPSISNHYSNNVLEYLNEHPDASNDEAIKKSLGFFAIFSLIITKRVGDVDKSILNIRVGEEVGNLIMRFIAFGILLVLFIILIIILRAIATKARENETVRIVDGIFGIILSLSLYLAAVTFLLFILKIFLDKNVITGGTYDFIAKDMQLNTNNFRITKYLYEANIYETIKGWF